MKFTESDNGVNKLKMLPSSLTLVRVNSEKLQNKDFAKTLQTKTYIRKFNVKAL